jgi:hypothetical protein
MLLQGLAKDWNESLVAQGASGSQVRRRVLRMPRLAEEAVLLASIEARVDALTGFDPT